jgi:LmbE family N-acetylglucosaminyl deacetylase
MTGKKVLIVAAHPDDEVLGCGGTIARYAGQGDEVYCLILGEGATSRSKHKDKRKSDSAVKQLRAQAAKAAQVLGIKEVSFQSLPDNRFDTVPMLDIVKIIESLIDKLQPCTIYTHHGADLNIDHQITRQAVLTAARPLQNCPVKEIYAFEVPSSTEWSFEQSEKAFHPNVFIDISETLETKVQAMQLYESETRPFPHPRSPDALRAIAHRWGSVAGVEAAEAFQLIRLIR